MLFFGPASPARLLVLEDDEEAADYLSVVLRHAGFQVEVERNDDHGISAARRLRPRTVIVNIGSGLHGLATCKALRALPETYYSKIIVYSACSDPKVIAAALAAGADYFLSKPDDRDRIVDTITGPLH